MIPAFLSFPTCKIWYNKIIVSITLWIFSMALKHEMKLKYGQAFIHSLWDIGCNWMSLHNVILQFYKQFGQKYGLLAPLWLIYILIQTPPVNIRHLEDRCSFSFANCFDISVCMSPCPHGRFTFWFRGITAAVKPNSELFPTWGGWKWLISPNALLQVWAEQVMQNLGVSQREQSWKLNFIMRDTSEVTHKVTRACSEQFCSSREKKN